MTENKKNNKNIKSLAEPALVQIKDESISKDEALIGFNNLTNKKTERSNNIFRNKRNNNKDTSENSLIFTKAKTKSREIEKRRDFFGNDIIKGGKQKVSFANKNFIEVIKIDSFKEYNKMEEVHPNNNNGCCLLI
jgi:hypothetical protein